MTLKKRGVKLFSTWAPTVLNTKKADVKEVHFSHKLTMNCKESIMKNSSMVMRALFIVIAGVIITTLWIQAVWSQTLSGNRRLLLQSPLFLYGFLHIYHRITFFFKRILSHFYFVLFLSVFSSGIIAEIGRASCRERV